MSKRRRKREDDGTKAPARRDDARDGKGFFDRRGTLIVCGLMGLYTLVFAALSLVKYFYFLYNDFDLAIFSQAAYMTLRGSMHSSILGVNYLGSHMSLTMPLIAPVYVVFPSPVTLLVIQTVVLSLGALPVYWLARRELKNGFCAVCFAAVYLLYPALGYSNLYEFHPETLATTTLLFTFYYLWVGRFVPMLVFALLSLMAKENAPPTVMMMGLYALVLRRPRRWVYAVTLVGLAVLFAVVTFAVVMPALSGGEMKFASLYSDWGDTTGEALVNMARSPLKVVKTFFVTPDDPEGGRVKREYYLHLFLPVMLLSLMSPLTLVMVLPTMAQHLLSSRPSEHTILFHYAAQVTPFVVAAAVLGLRNVLRLLVRGLPDGLTDEVMNTRTPPRTLARIMSVTVVAAAVVCNLLFGPVLGRGVLQHQAPQEKKWPSEVDRVMAPQMRRMAARLPVDVPVAVGFRFLARATHRSDVQSMHLIYKGTHDLSERPYPIPEDIEAMLLDTSDWRYTSFWREDGGSRVRGFIRGNHLQLADAAGDVLLFLRDAKGTDDPFAKLFESNPPRVPRNGGHVFDGRLTLVGWDAMPLMVKVGETFPITTYWRPVGGPDRTHVLIGNPDTGTSWKAAVICLTQFVLWGRDGKPVSSPFAHIGYTLYPFHEWDGEETVRITYHFVVPADLVAGNYKVLVRLAMTVKGGRPQLVVPDHVDAAQRRSAIPIGEVTVVGAAD